jgi:error-prone DNA polymerase
VAEDYLSLGLSLRAHPCAFLRERLRRLGAKPNAEHRRPELAPNARVTVAGLVLIRQRPGTAKGVVFLTLEDETGIANVIVWRDRFEADRRIFMSAHLVAIRGRLQRTGEVVHVLAEDVLDLSAELRRLREDPGAGEAALRLKSRDFH